MKLTLQSFSDPAIYYKVDSENRTCSCSIFQGKGWCKHLISVGQYQPTRVMLTAAPSYSQALSAVVKSIRIRNVEEGAYWLNYCWGFRENLNHSQFRTVHRLLIGAAEDGHSIAVMEKLSGNFDALLAKDVEFSRVMAELVRICKVPNWWHPCTGGPKYIYTGMVAQRHTLYDQEAYSIGHCLSSIASAIDDQDMVSALFWVMKADELGKDAGPILADRLYEIALARNHGPALRLMTNVYLRHAMALSDDNNFIGQATWLLAGGNSQVIDQIETVTHNEVRQILDKVNSTAPYVIPEWCCDGVHCAGYDTRYMGMWDRMYAVCQQFNHYQRVNPSDPWLEEEFYSMDGLEFNQGGSL